MFPRILAQETGQTTFKGEYKMLKKINCVLLSLLFSISMLGASPVPTHIVAPDESYGDGSNDYAQSGNVTIP